ncbi:hypothetical protein L596_022662 [Steinernema carpocapsae]|uniref:Uncharacterized protein n=1 Tax=Steinernema carpocapsae TaxID=34508 RepID=A0A4U5MMC9_STECR|nr:hypothetical protein L596_022662 [Steinernema carpocapsae]
MTPLASSPRKRRNKRSVSPRSSTTTCSIALLWFLKFSTCNPNTENNYDNSVAYWIENVEGKEGKFTAFPPSDKWTRMGFGYDRDAFGKLSKDEKKAKQAICDPKTYYYDMDKRAFEKSNGKNAHTVEHTEFDYSGARCGDEEEYRKDPFIQDTVLRVSGNFSEIRMIQTYQMHSLRSYQSANDQQWYAIFNQRNPKHVEEYVNGTRENIPVGKLCFLRRYRPGLNEMHDLFLLPSTGKEIVVKKDEGTFFTTPSTTTTSILTPTTSTTSTSTECKEENQKSDKEVTKEHSKTDGSETQDEPDFGCSAAPSIIVVLIILTLGLVDARATKKADNVKEYLLEVKTDARTFRACSMFELKNNFLHAFTCRGYVRIPVVNHTFQDMNMQIDALLEANKDFNKGAPCPLVKAFWDNHTWIIFLKFSTGDPESEKNCDKTHYLPLFVTAKWDLDAPSRSHFAAAAAAAYPCHIQL